MAVLGPVCIACGAPSMDASQGVTTVEDSAGVTIVTNSGAVPVGRWRLGSAPVRILGLNSDDPRADLHLAGSTTRLASGAIAVGNGSARVVVIFEEDGTTRFAGRDGRGPGEFASFAFRVLPSPPGLLLVEQLVPNYKLMHFTDRGEFLREVNVQRRVADGAVWDFATSASGTAFHLAEGLIPVGELSARPARVGNVVLRRFDYEAQILDTVARYPGTERFAADVGPRPAFGGGMVSGPRALTALLGASASLAGGGDPFVAVAGDQAQAALDVFGEDGALQRRIRWIAPPRRVSAEDVRLLHEQYGRGRPGGDEAALQRELAAMPTLGTTPVFDRILVDRTSGVWVRRYPLPTDEFQGWWVFDPVGQLVELVRIPANLEVLEIGAEYVLGLARDDLDVERIELWPLER
jgi:hypothetical protein